MKSLTRNVLGLALGGIIGWLSTPALLASEPGKMIASTIQAIVSYRIDPQNAACWDQPGLTLAEANALRVEVSYDAPNTIGAPGGTFVSTGLQCKGTAAPWQCNVTTQMPMALQTVGRHRAVVRTMTFDPVDGSISPPTIATDFLFDLRNAPAPPPPGNNGRIIRIIIGGLIAAAAGLFRLLG